MSETRWLTAEEQRTWRAFLGASRQLVAQLDHELQRDAGMPVAYYEILVMLSEAPERTLRMSDLATFTTSSRSRLSHAVDRLEAKGWVRRVGCPNDKRGAFAVLTEGGAAALAAAAPGHVEGVRRHLFDQITPDQVRQLGAIAEAIATDLAQATRRESTAGAPVEPAVPRDRT